MIARTNVLHTLNLAGGMRLRFVPLYTLEQLQQKNIKELKEIGLQLNVLPEGDKRCRQNWIDALVGVNPPLLQLLELSPAASVVEQVQPIIETVETPSAVEVEPVQTLPIESKFGRIVYLRPAQNSIEDAVETSPGVEVDPIQELIAPAAEKFPGVERVTEPQMTSARGDRWSCGISHHCDSRVATAPAISTTAIDCCACSAGSAIRSITRKPITPSTAA